MMPDICFLVFSYIGHVCQNFGTPPSSLQQFYGNCRALDTIKAFETVTFVDIYFEENTTYFKGKVREKASKK